MMNTISNDKQVTNETRKEVRKMRSTKILATVLSLMLVLWPMSAAWAGKPFMETTFAGTAMISAETRTTATGVEIRATVILRPANTGLPLVLATEGWKERNSLPLLFLVTALGFTARHPEAVGTDYTAVIISLDTTSATTTEALVKNFAVKALQSAY